jgi:hypothetical protein
MDFRIGNQVNMTIKANEIEIGKNLVATGTLSVGKAGNPWNAVYATNVTASSLTATADIIAGAGCNVLLNTTVKTNNI